LIKGDSFHSPTIMKL